MAGDAHAHARAERGRGSGSARRPRAMGPTRGGSGGPRWVCGGRGGGGWRPRAQEGKTRDDAREEEAPEIFSSLACGALIEFPAPAPPYRGAGALRAL
jgi:hypothetical protein